MIDVLNFFVGVCYTVSVRVQGCFRMVTYQYNMVSANCVYIYLFFLYYYMFDANVNRVIFWEYAPTM